MRSAAVRHADDRGAVLIYAAVVMVGLMAMATFVVDFGMFWVSRQQAQNAADAAAYAAAVALGQDITGDRTDSGPATQTALSIARQNLVWGEQPAIAASDITFPTCPVDGTDMCVRVAVYRSASRSNPLPMVFGRLVGLTTQDVQAVATAEMRPGNINQCLKPWAIPDLWAEHSAPPNSTFDPATDFYTPPGANTTGTGYSLNRDLGTALTLHQACSTATTCPAATAGRFLPLKLSSGGCAGTTYQNTIVGCTACAGVPVDTFGVNDAMVFLPGSQTGPTTNGAQALYNLDPTAVFNPVTKKVENSCVGGGGIPYSCKDALGNPVPGLVESPRIVAVPAYDVAWFESHRAPAVANAGNLIHVTNILSLFIDSSAAGDVMTHVVTKSGAFDPSKGVVTGGSGFTRTLLIVR